MPGGWIPRSWNSVFWQLGGATASRGTHGRRSEPSGESWHCVRRHATPRRCACRRVFCRQEVTSASRSQLVPRQRFLDTRFFAGTRSRAATLQAASNATSPGSIPVMQHRDRSGSSVESPVFFGTCSAWVRTGVPAEAQARDRPWRRRTVFGGWTVCRAWTLSRDPGW